MDEIDRLIDRLSDKLAAIECRVAKLEREDAASGADPPGKVAPGSPAPRGRQRSVRLRPDPGRSGD